MALQANWHSIEFSDFIPPVVSALLASPPNILGVVDAYSIAKRALQLAAAAKFIPDITLPTPQDLQIAAISLFLDALRKATLDLANTGMYLLLIPPESGGVAQLGGLTRMKRFIKTSLLNSRDPRRPFFSSDAYVFAAGGLAYGVDIPAVQEAFTVTTNVLTSNIQQKRAAGVETLQTLQGVARSYFKNQLTGDAGPVERSVWQSMRLTDLTPGLNDILLGANSLLQGLSQSVTLKSVQSYFDFADRQFRLVTGLLDKIQSALAIMNSALEQFPILMFGAAPSQGGLDALISATVDDFYNPVKHPELIPVKDNTFTTGFLLVGGAPSPSVAETQYNLLKGIYQLP